MAGAARQPAPATSIILQLAQTAPRPWRRHRVTVGVAVGLAVGLGLAVAVAVAVGQRDLAVAIGRRLGDLRCRDTARCGSAPSAGPASTARRRYAWPPGCRPPRSSSRRRSTGRRGTADRCRSFRIRFVLLRTAMTGMPCSTAASVGRPTQPSGMTRAEMSSAWTIDGS